MRKEEPQVCLAEWKSYQNLLK